MIKCLKAYDIALDNVINNHSSFCLIIHPFASNEVLRVFCTEIGQPVYKDHKGIQY